jgi:branched-chain amino acid transport system permease protein
VLIIAVIGGMARLEGAWIGAIAYVLIDNYSRQWTPTVGNWLGPGRFATIIGIVFLIIVLLSPDGLIGIAQRVRTRLAPAPATTPGLRSAPGEEPAPGQPAVPAAPGSSSPDMAEA